MVAVWTDVPFAGGGTRGCFLAGWALGFGRTGQIGEPLIGGTLLGMGWGWAGDGLGMGWASRDIFLAEALRRQCIGARHLAWLVPDEDGSVRRLRTPPVPS